MDIMASSKPVETQMPRWQLALLVGTPLVLGVGAVYLWNRSRSEGSGSGDREPGSGERSSGERKTPEGSASPEARGQEQDSMAGKYENAIQCYTEAIALCPTEQKTDLSTFYQNRAAAYEQQAVDMNPRYIKALFRRAKALEKLENRRECLEDVTAVCILEAFQNQQSMLLADKNREPMMPSPQFIKSYFSSFTDDIISQPLQKGEKKDEDKDKEGETAEVTESSGYLKAKQFMEEENYDKIISECSKEVELGGRFTAEALLLRATFFLLIGNATSAQPDLDRVINMQDANVKKELKVRLQKELKVRLQKELKVRLQKELKVRLQKELKVRLQKELKVRLQKELKVRLQKELKVRLQKELKVRLQKELKVRLQKELKLKILLDQVDEAYRQAYTGNNSSQVQTAMDGFEDVIRRFPKL
ncbi:hypothetical protein F7725_027100 [Dissostichus mawsoni]|uniref:Uncharacterized protein n=1 Tax=Dissostichus mawsoni TaxID=36200 RepID=A0A7J5XBY5_DISMA|nr:hypothetical protein F7725_027100 [Dissostichus mawsoni]